MNFKKIIIFVIFSITVLILSYNLFIAPELIQNVNVNSSGMGMHMSVMNRNTQVYNDYSSIISLIIIVLMITGLVSTFIYFFKSPRNRCSKCGYDIKNHSWKICPICGAKTRRIGR